MSLSVQKSGEKKKQREDVRSREGKIRRTIADTQTEICTLDIEILNGADHTETCELVVGLIGNDAETGEEFLRVAAKKPVTVSANHTASEVVTQAFRETEVREMVWVESVALTVEKRRRTGKSYCGYLVLLKIGGEIVAKESSSVRYLKDDRIALCEGAWETWRRVR